MDVLKRVERNSFYTIRLVLLLVGEQCVLCIIPCENNQIYEVNRLSMQPFYLLSCVPKAF